MQNYHSDPPMPEAPEAFAPPHSREAEEAVAGCILIAPEFFQDFTGVLSSRDFFIQRIGFIWSAFERLFLRNAGIDILTVSEELDDMGHLEEIGGVAYLTSLLNQAPTTLHLESYAGIVKNLSGKRQFLAMANKLAEFSMNGKSAQEIAAYVEKETARISISACVETGSILSSAEAVKLGMEATESAAKGKVIYVPTGLTDLDKLFRGGLREGRFMLIAGRPGDGKSSFLLTVANNAAAKYKKRVGFFSQEMPTEEQINRLIAQLSGIDFSRIESGQLQDDDWPTYYHAVEVAHDLQIYWDDTPSLTVSQLRSKARKMSEMGLDLICLDSLNLMNAQMPGAKTFEKIDEMAKQLKVLARELRVPVLAAHHMSRAIETGGDREPQLSDLEQAGEKHADIVSFIYQKKDDATQANVRHIKTAKHRGGPLGTISTIFRGNITKFDDAVSRSVSLREPPPAARNWTERENE